MRLINGFLSLLLTTPHLPYAVGVKLNTKSFNAVILTSESSDLTWCLRSSLSFLVEVYIQGEAMDVARSAPQGHH